MNNIDAVCKPCCRNLSIRFLNVRHNNLEFFSCWFPIEYKLSSPPFSQNSLSLDFYKEWAITYRISVGTSVIMVLAQMLQGQSINKRQVFGS